MPLKTHPARRESPNLASTFSGEDGLHLMSFWPNTRPGAGSFWQEAVSAMDLGRSSLGERRRAAFEPKKSLCSRGFVKDLLWLSFSLLQSWAWTSARPLPGARCAALSAFARCARWRTAREAKSICREGRIWEGSLGLGATWALIMALECLVS